jgi:hypothetical protein
MIHRLEKAGLGYHMSADDTDDRFSSSGGGSIPLRQLVYRVKPLPPSLLPLVWDFGTLTPQAEAKYINRIVTRYTQGCTDNAPNVKLITDILTKSQDFMKQQSNECGFVSLRGLTDLFQTMFEL